MTAEDAFQRWIRSQLESAGRCNGCGAEAGAASLARVCAAALPGAGVTVALFDDDAFRFPLGASETASTLAEQLEFTAGGPGLEAHRIQTAVMASPETLMMRWPGLWHLLLAMSEFRMVIAVPMSAPLSKLVVQFWFTSIEQFRVFGAEEIARVVDAAAPVFTAILPPADIDPERGWVAAAQAPRQQVMIATGLVAASHRINFPDALAVLRAAAFARTTTADELARALVAGSLHPHQL